MLSLEQQKGKLQGNLPTCAHSHSGTHFVSLSSIQKGRDEYKLAATSDDGVKKAKKGKGDKKDMDELKKEVDLVSTHNKNKPFRILST